MCTGRIGKRPAGLLQKQQLTVSGMAERAKIGAGAEPGTDPGRWGRLGVVWDEGVERREEFYE